MIAIERADALAAIEAAKGRLPDAAKALGISHRTLCRRVGVLGLERELAKIRAKRCPHCGRPW